MGAKETVMKDGENVLASPLWRPLHDILIDWNEGKMKIDKDGIRKTLVGRMASGENNIKAVKAMIEVIAPAQAEITWEARQKEVDEAREAGRQEIIKQVKENTLFSAEGLKELWD